MAGIELEAEIDGIDELQQLASRGARAIVAAVATAADELAHTDIPAEAPRRTGTLASDWHVTESDPLHLTVHAGDEAWYAHIVARGRDGMVPIRRRALTIEGAFRAFAGPTSGDPFHERAVGSIARRVDRILDDALADEGLT